MSYRAAVGDVLEVLAEGLAPYVDRRMAAHLRSESDWILAAAGKLGKRPDVLVSVSDPQFQLEVISRFWGPVFAKDLHDRARTTVADLLEARNNWAHINEEQPIDLAYAHSVHRLVGTLLDQTGSPLGTRVRTLEQQLQATGVKDEAASTGLTEQQVVLQRMADLERERERFHEQLAAARNAAASQSGRTKAVSRQLHELQTQYAAVAGMQDRYRQLELEMEELREDGDATGRARLLAAQEAVALLQGESGRLQTELVEARAAMDDPALTAAGQRWMWLTASLLVMLTMIMALITI